MIITENNDNDNTTDMFEELIKNTSDHFDLVNYGQI